MSQLLLSALGIVCPVCDEHNAPKSAKCSSCGADMLAAAPAKGSAPAGRSGTQDALKPAARPPTAPAVPSIAPVQTARPPTAASVPAARAGAPTAQPGTGARPSGLKPALQPLGSPAAPPGMKPARAPTSDPIPATELGVRKPSRPEAAAPPSAGRYAVVLASGTAAGQRFRLSAATVQVGRSRGLVLFPEDPFVSAQHATFVNRDGKLYIRDDQSASGVFVSVQQELIKPDSFFSAGHRLFRYGGALEPQPQQRGAPVVYGAPVPLSQSVYLIEEIIVGGRPGRAVITSGPLLTIGQALCDLTFPEDDALATRHCELSPAPSGAVLRDLSGGLGTFVKIKGERALAPGDRIRIGEQILQVELAA